MEAGSTHFGLSCSQTAGCLWSLLACHVPTGHPQRIVSEVNRVICICLCLHCRRSPRGLCATSGKASGPLNVRGGLGCVPGFCFMSYRVLEKARNSIFPLTVSLLARGLEGGVGPFHPWQGFWMAFVRPAQKKINPLASWWGHLSDWAELYL